MTTAEAARQSAAWPKPREKTVESVGIKVPAVRRQEVKSGPVFDAVEQIKIAIRTKGYVNGRKVVIESDDSVIPGESLFSLMFGRKR